MERKSEDNNANSRFNTQRSGDSGSKTPKLDKVKQDTAKKISDNFKKNKDGQTTSVTHKCAVVLF